MPRPSPVLDALRSLFSDPDKHALTLDEVLGELQHRRVPADFSSVFRGMARLEREGTATRVDLGDGRTRFESASAHHEHVRCTACGTVAEVPGCLVEEAVDAVSDLTGFAVTGHSLTFSGTCPTCALER